MRALTRGLAIGFLLANSGEASANWRDDNPNQPNGYAASMYRYHHGTPDDDGPHDGYRASSFRSRNGLDRFAPPSEDGGDGGDGGGRWGSGGGGFGSGSGLGRHFRQGQAESEAFWQNRMQSQMQGRLQNQFGPAGGASLGSSSSMMNSPLRTRPAQFNFQQMKNGAPSSMPMQQLPMQQMPMRQMPMRQMPMQQMPVRQMPMQQMSMAQTPIRQAQQFPPMYGTRVSAASGATNVGMGQMPAPAFPGEYPVPMSNNYHYAPNSTGYGNAGALRSAVMQHPVGSLLRNSQGGFNQIYAPPQ